MYEWWPLSLSLELSNQVNFFRLARRAGDAGDASEFAGGSGGLAWESTVPTYENSYMKMKNTNVHVKQQTTMLFCVQYRVNANSPVVTHRVQQGLQAKILEHPSALLILP